MKKLNKALSLILAGSMVVSMLATGAFAAGAPTYSDVPASASYSEAVEYLSAEKILDGIGGGKFGPQNTVTRAQVITALGRMAGAKQVETRDFTDVVPNSWYSGYAGWAVENGIVQGDGKGHFMPDRMVTSEELNLMLSRYAKSVDRNVEFYDTGAATVSRADLAQRLYTLAMAVEKGDYTTFEFAKTTGGQIRGYKYSGIYTFMGIPYAKAGRFEEPQDTSWEDILDCVLPGPVSPQFTAYTNGSDITDFTEHGDIDQFESEDCLNLNVWTKSLDSSAKKPVIVWYHGGGMSSGSSIEVSSYDGHNLVDYGDVVFVSVNARLNVLGFLDLSALGDKYKNSGNLGMMDNVKALEWVNKNIANFGGDPNNVTIIGQSGGGAKVMTIMGMPSANGLFQRVWAMSGGTTTGRNPEESKNDGINLKKYLVENKLIREGEDPVEYLKSMRYDELRALCSTAGASASGPVQDGVIYQGTVIDGKFTKQASKYPLIVSSTFSEMFAGNLQPMMFAAPGLNDVKQLTPGDPMVHLTDKYGDAAETIAEVFQEAYPCRDLIDAIYVDTGRTSYIERATNMANSGGKVWLAMFSYKLPLLGGVESWHTGGDVPFLFHNVSRLGYQIAGDEVNARAYQDVCASALIAYAYTGDPSTEQLSWPQYTVENGASMVFDLESYVGYHHDAELLKLVEENTQASS